MIGGKGMIIPLITEATKQLPVYVVGIGTKYPPEDISRPFGCTHYQICVIKEGTGIFEFRDKHFHLSPGSVFYFKKEIPHQYYSLSPDYEEKWITMDGAFCNVMFDKVFGDDIGCFQLKELNRFLNDYEKIYSLLDEREPMYEILCCSYIIKTISNLAKANQEKTVSEKKLERLEPIILYMEKHYSKVISLKQLASLIGVSEYTLCTLFREAYGTSAINYLMKLRIQMAKILLSKDKELPVKEIAKRVGFNDVSYFGKIFKKFENITPQTYRQD